MWKWDGNNKNESFLIFMRNFLWKTFGGMIYYAYLCNRK